MQAPRIEANLFVGRDLEIQHMARLVEVTDTANEQRRLVLGGIGGVGKTQLAIAFAQRYREMFSSVIWLNATSESTLKTSLRTVAELILTQEYHQALDTDEILVRVKRWLSNAANARWLLIFDNYDEPQSYDITKYYPYTSQGNIVVTTHLPDQVSGQQLLVSPLQDLGHGLHILETRSRRPDVASGEYFLLLSISVTNIYL